MIVSVAEEMNPTRRNTMEDACVICPAGSWNAPDANAIFLSVMDGHGGRRIADYLEDHLANNVASEWSHSAHEMEEGRGRRKMGGGDGGGDGGGVGGGNGKEGNEEVEGGEGSSLSVRHRRKANDDDYDDINERTRKRHRRTHANDVADVSEETLASTSTKGRGILDVQGEVVRVALERAFLLTDVRSRIDGILTSGATVACCVVIPNYHPHSYEYGDDDAANYDDEKKEEHRRRRRRRRERRRKPTSISIHAANAGDARAVLSSNVARGRRRRRFHRDGGCGGVGVGGDGSSRSDEASTSIDGGNSPIASSSSSSSTRSQRLLPHPPPPRAIRITRDHKSTDPDEVERIIKSGGIVLRGRVLGVLAVARSIGDHGLKEYVIGRPHVSSTIVDIVEEEEEEGEEDYGEDSNADANSSPYTDGEFLIVACDGLWDVMSDQEAVDLVRIHHREHLVEDDDGREVAASFLVEEALRRGSADNITAVVYWL